MLAMSRLVNHEPDSGRLSIKSSGFGEMCLHSLKSSSRELRLVSGYFSSLYLESGTLTTFQERPSLFCP